MWLEIGLGIIFLLALWQTCKKPEGLPPGLWGLPLIGHLSYPLIPTQSRVKLLKEKYGDIFVIRIGAFVNVFLCRYALCKEACVKAEIASRPAWKFFNLMNDGENLGLSGSDGLPWHNTRRFTLRHLSDLGMGKTSMVEAIQLEAREMIKGFEACAGGFTDLDQFLNVAVVNVIWQLLSNRRYDVGDESSKWFHKLILDMQHGYDRIFILDFFPWLTRILPLWIKKKLFGYEKLMHMKEQISGYFMNIIEDHKRKLDPFNPRDFIDAYLLEMEDRKGDPRNTFKEKDLVSTLWDLYVAGSDTASNTLRWFVLYMAKYPDVQRKAQREIDDVIPRDVQPSWEDKDKLPYTEAVIHEVHRMVSLTPLGIQHTTTKDVTLSNGYRIPKGAILYPVVFCSHNEERHWDNHSEFRPERFLDANGKFICPRDGFMPFGVGRRQCVGEPLARMEAIIFCTSMLQKLYFSPGPDGVILESMQIPIVNHPKHQWVKVDVRRNMEIFQAA